MFKFFNYIKTHKAVKVILIVTLSLVTVACAGLVGFSVIMNKMSELPDAKTADETFEYTTKKDLLSLYSFSDDEKIRIIDSYSNNEAYSVYKRAYTNFLNKEAFYVSSLGYTDAGGILVNINNSKKFNGTNYYMHMVSMANSSNPFSSLSNSNSKHYVYVTDSNSKNLATILQLEPGNDSNVKKKTVLTEKDYVFNYGSIPYAVCDYIITEDTILSSTFEYDSENNLYKICFNLNPLTSTTNIVKKMYAISGTNESYANGSVEYTVYVDQNFDIKIVNIKETYSAGALGVTLPSTGELTDYYYYEGDENFLPILAEEMFDVNDIPEDVDEEEVRETLAQISSAIDKVLANGINADLSFGVKDFSLEGKLQAKLDNGIILQLDCELLNENVSLYVQLNKDHSGKIIANLKNKEFALSYENLGDLANEIISLIGVDLGMDVGAIINGLDFSDMISSLKEVSGTKDQEKYLYVANLKDMGLPIDIPLDIVIENQTVTSFAIDNQDVMGTVINLSLTPSEQQKTLTEKEISANAKDFTSLITNLLDCDLDVQKIIDIVSEKKVGFALNGKLLNYTFNANVNLDFNNDILASAVINIGGIQANVYFEQNELFLKVNDLALRISVDKILEYVNNFIELPSLDIDIESLIFTAIDVLLSHEYKDKTLKVIYEDILLSINKEVIGLTYGETVNANITNLSTEVEITKPQAEYVNLNNADNLVNVIKEQIEQKHFNISANVSYKDIEIQLSNLSLDITDEIAVSGKVSIPSLEIELDIAYINGYVFVNYNNQVKVKVSVESIEKLAEYGKQYLPKLTEIFDLGEITEIIDAVKEFIENVSIERVQSLISEINVTEKEFALKVNGEQLKLGEINVTANYENEVKVNVTLLDIILNATLTSNEQVEIAEIEDCIDVSNLLENVIDADFDIDTVIDIISKKKVSLEIDGNALGIEIYGIVNVDFNNGLIAKALLSIDGVDFTIYFEQNELFVSVNNVAVKISVEQLMNYIGMFVEMPSTEIDLNVLINKITDVLGEISYTDKTLGIALEDLILSLNKEIISISYSDKISAEIIHLSTVVDTEKPNISYADLNNIESLVSKIEEQIEQSYFNFDITANIKGTEVIGEDIKINNKGDLKDPTSSFDNGLLPITGKILVPSKNLKFEVTYCDADLYVIFNDTLKLLLKRQSLDNIVDILLDNYKDVIQRLNYSEILDATSVLMKLKDFEISVSNIVPLLNTITVEDGNLVISANLSDFGIDNAVIKACEDNGALSLQAIFNDSEIEITLNNEEFEDIVAPTGTYIDLSNIDYLLEGAINSVLKPSLTYYLKGSAKVDVLNIVSVNVDMEASVRLVDDGEGNKSIEAVVKMSNLDKSFGGSIIENYLKYGTSTLIYKDGMIYIERTDYSYPFLGIGSLKKGNTVKNKMTRQYFGDNALNQIFYFMGLSDSLMKSVSENKNGIKLEKLLVDYTGTPSSQTVVLSGSELAGSSLLGNITANIGIENGQLSSLSAVIPIILITEIDMTANFTHVLDSLGDFTAITNLNVNEYSLLG